VAGRVARLYSVGRPERQRRHAWLIVPIFVAGAGLGGCGNLGSVEVTGSIPKAPVAQAVRQPDPTAARPATVSGSASDWEAVKASIARARPDRKPTRIEWANGETGNSGTISEVIAAAPRAGSPCRNFATTVASVDGVRMYRGEACRAGADGWEITTVEPADRRPGGQGPS
jgi:hypothetical protein